jgi:hypothetical protein
VTNDFDKNGYVHLKDFLNKDNCKELTKVLKELVDQKKTHHDEQCPTSEAIHGNETFDQLLLDLLPHFEKACGKKLYPTYSYARLYKPGEELKKHTDRPACEISATVTLGFEGDVWSIFMAGNKVDMQVGDAVLYRGMDLEHWREKYTEGKWQAQVFLHYVDADGPHADQKYDGRSSLGEVKPNFNNEVITPIAVFENHLTSDFCDKLISVYSQDTIDKELPYIGITEGTIDKTVRNTERVLLPQNVGIGATLASTALNANSYWWKYNITHSNQTELLIYKPDGHYAAHIDTFHEHSDNVRKLTALAFLNDDFEGGKFYIQTSHERYYPPQKKGTIVVFPSYMLHGVEPVTKGIRYSVVSWMAGPYFK